jgi:hypothetical protein
LISDEIHGQGRIPVPATSHRRGVLYAPLSSSTLAEYPLEEMAMRNIVRLTLCIVAQLLSGTAFAAAPAAVAAPIPRLAVLDIELTGDLGGPQLKTEQETRLRMASERLRRELASSGLFQVVDNAPAQALIDKLKSQQRYLHDCNGCDLEVGKRLGADEVLVAWVDRVSNLILSLTYEIDDVKTGQIDDRKSYDFRGDNDAAWIHAIDFMVQDMKERRTAPPLEQPHS